MPPCTAEASWNVHGGVSLLSRGNGRPTPCTNSTTVNAMVAFVLDRLGLAAVRPASHTAAVLADSGSSGPGEGASGALLQPQQQLQEQQQQEQQRQRAAAAAQQMLRQKQLPPAAGPGAPPGSVGRVRQRLLWALRSNRATHQEGILRLLRQQLEERGGVEVRGAKGLPGVYVRCCCPRVCPMRCAAWHRSPLLAGCTFTSPWVQRSLVHAIWYAAPPAARSLWL